MDYIQNIPRDWSIMTQEQKVGCGVAAERYVLLVFYGMLK